MRRLQGPPMRLFGGEPQQGRSGAVQLFRGEIVPARPLITAVPGGLQRLAVTTPNRPSSWPLLNQYNFGIRTRDPLLINNQTLSDEAHSWSC